MKAFFFKFNIEGYGEFFSGITPQFGKDNKTTDIIYIVCMYVLVAAVQLLISIKNQFCSCLTVNIYTDLNTHRILII